MRIAITCPIYLTNNIHRDFLNRTTKSLATNHTFLWIPVENYVAAHYMPLQYHFTQQPNEIYVIQGRQPQSVSKGWNTGIEKGIEVEADYILVINDDIIMRKDSIDNLVKFAEEHADFVIWTMGGITDLFSMNEVQLDENWSEHPNFSSYMIRKDFFTHVGKFDENIHPAYFEDSSMHGRLALYNKKAVVYGGAGFFHFGSRTINSDYDYKQEMPAMFRKNAAYFEQMFGCGVINEVDEMRKKYYKYPYNIEGLSWKEPIPDFWDFLAKQGVSHISQVNKQVVLDYVASKRNFL